ncbi:hypothetical protein ACFSND_32975 [Brevibacillus brevis]|uniref:hypothetical protein n=1 Tax=Brevibacillus brevis TaxID=1393 RepID=UPI003625E550
MGRKLYEFTIKMSGKMNRSFTSAFDNASRRMQDMRKKISEYQASIEKANGKLQSMSTLHSKMSAAIEKTKRGLCLFGAEIPKWRDQRRGVQTGKPEAAKRPSTVYQRTKESSLTGR